MSWFVCFVSSTIAHGSAELNCEGCQRAHLVTLISSRSAIVGGIDVVHWEGIGDEGEDRRGGYRAPVYLGGRATMMQPHFQISLC